MAPQPKNSYRGLANKVFPGALSMAQGHATIFYIALPFAVAGLNGPIFGSHKDHNGIIFLGGALLCPCIAALVLTLFPFRPYQGSPFLPGSKYVDTRDPDMERLVSIFQSSQLNSFLWRSTFQLMILLISLMTTLAIAERKTLEWSWQLPPATAIFTALVLYIVLNAAVMNWGFRTYSDTLGDGMSEQRDQGFESFSHPPQHY
jgi:MFS family permease